MSRSKEDKLRKLISKAEPQKPADDIAGLVMQQIAAAAEDEIAINPALKELIKKHGANATPMGFTNRVMAQINPQQVKSLYKPVISKKAWYGIAASVLCVLVITGLPGNSAQRVFSTSIGANTAKQVAALPAVYLITLVSVGMLLVIEHFITSRLTTRR